MLELNEKAREEARQAEAKAEGRELPEAFYDTLFRKRTKKGYKVVDEPTPPLEGAIADTHAHLQMLTHRDLSIARAAMHHVEFICDITDITEDAGSVYTQLSGWLMSAGAWIQTLADGEFVPTPEIRLACGCHPHNARLYDNGIERMLLDKLADVRTSCLGEIGLDYHYDLSPRDKQKRVFARQLELAHRTGLPVSLHLREAHDDALAIIREVGVPEAGMIVHCFNMGADVLRPFLELDAYIAIGGPVTFASGDALREALPLIPRNRLLTETDCPFMSPVPLRGTENAPDNTVFTVAKIAEVLGVEPGADRRALMRELYANAQEILNRAPTTWQLSQQHRG